MIRSSSAFLLALLLSSAAMATPRWGTEAHDRLAAAPGAPATPVAITLDACGGAFDASLIQTLVDLRVPATIFVTKKWLDHNPAGTAVLLAHPDLFELEDHGTSHMPAVIGKDRRIYGIPAAPDAAHVEAEVAGAAQAIRTLTGRAPVYFRGATAIYDAQSLQIIRAMGYQVAGFSVNADAGATLPEADIAARLRAVRPGDIVIAHMNKPAGATAEAFAATLPQLLARGYRFVTLSGARLQPV
ncbi:polysaccharide deacetylase family protein [Roseateles sp. BYS78W]|uniref:Polysaccharide deacetylase family protein n=1 Tax=Pelomonas candidula TaxID=3299025 RepID=A0ABW7HBN1_9BURK